MSCRRSRAAAVSSLESARPGMWRCGIEHDGAGQDGPGQTAASHLVHAGDQAEAESPVAGSPLVRRAQAFGMAAGGEPAGVRR